MGLMDRMNDIDQKIDILTSITESMLDDKKDSFYESELALYEEKYDAIQDAKRKVESLYESGSITEEEYEETNSYLTEAESETEKIVYPYMTEAAKAINVALSRVELKEYNSSEVKRILNMKDKEKLNVSDKTWLRRRIKCLTKIQSDLVLLGKFKKEKMTQEEAHKFSGCKSENCKILSAKKYVSDSNTVIAVVWKEDDVVKSKFTSSTNKEFYALSVALTTGYASFIDQKVISWCIKQWNNYKKTTDKAIKESVLLNDDMDKCFAYIEMAVEDNAISRNMANYYKEYVTTLQEKENLLYSLENRL